MVVYRNHRWLLEQPHAAAFVLLVVNVFVFSLCLRASGTATISPEVLLLNGAMYSQALARHEYWRLAAYGFLHADLLHLAGNMLCLVLWGGPLEKRVGSFYFLVIYFGAMVAGAIISDLYHAQPYLAVGGSGAISGVLGALLCLWMLGKIDLSVGFFVANIGLNVALALALPRIDWVAHIGGFAAGLAICALIDGLERTSKLLLRCKFPEFVKLNGGVLAVGLFIWAESSPSLGDMPGWLLLIGYAASLLGAIKLIDLALSMKKGLAIVVATFCAGNAALAWLLGNMAGSPLRRGCVSVPQPGGGGSLIELACAHWQVTIALIAAGAFALTSLLYTPEFRRGIADVGFVGATMMAERRRRRGI